MCIVWEWQKHGLPPELDPKAVPDSGDDDSAAVSR
jgi:hypothetical protein